MRNPSFNFKQFTVWHDRCAMKVGTDGVLLGAWCSADNADFALDIGTGSGLIALMLAQRTQAKVIGIDIDADAVAQAANNFRQSPFAARLTALQADFAAFAPAQSFGLIVSNPPFFAEDTASPNSQRDQARRATNLPLSVLLSGAKKLLAPGGKVAIVVPQSQAAEAVFQASQCGLHLCRRCDVRSTPAKPPLRALLEWTDRPCQSQISALCLHGEGGARSDDYARLTEDFNLK